MQEEPSIVSQSSSCPDAAGRPGQQRLELSLSPEMSEYVVREAHRRGMGACDFAHQLLARGLCEQRLEEVLGDIRQRLADNRCSLSPEARLVADVEVKALLCALGSLQQSPVAAAAHAEIEAHARALIDRLRA